MKHRDFLEVCARALNARDLDTVVGYCSPQMRVILDGLWVGEGQKLAAQALRGECDRSPEAVDRLTDLDGEQVLVAWTGEANRDRPSAVLRFAQEGDWITECRIDHDRRLLERVAAGFPLR